MIARLLAVSLIWTLPAVSQVTGRFYLEKAQFSPTEPVFVYLSVTNTGSEPIDMSPFDAEQPMCSGVSFELFKDGRQTNSCLLFSEKLCVMNGQFSKQVHLGPGQSHTDRYLLNYHHDLNVPGNYRLEAERTGFPGNRLQSVKATMLFRIDAGAAPISSTEILSWVNQLHSSDIYKRTEAARTLASIAPPSIENTLFGFTDSSEFRRYSALALFRLHTPRSMEALAGLVRKGPPGSSEALESAQYLARSGDQKWYPLLLEAAQKSPQIGYPTYAAELGGESSIAALVEMANTSVEFDSGGRTNAIMALGSTHSRIAVPVLLEFLRSGDEATSDRAAYSLRVLTHRTAFADPQARDHNLEVIKWSEWWKREGRTARIYRDEECVDPVPLP